MISLHPYNQESVRHPQAEISMPIALLVASYLGKVKFVIVAL
jgi:hypothetical protein